MPYPVAASRGMIFGGASVAPPAQPTGLTATPASTSQINLAWTDNATDETAYKVYRSTDGASYAQVGTDLAVNANSYNDTPISAGTKYYYKVAAVNSGGETLSTAATANTLTYALAGVYTLNEASGNRLDSIGTRHMIPQGTVNQAAGKFGNAASFPNLAADHLSTAADNSLLAIDWSLGFTVAGWIYVPSVYDTAFSILTKYSGANMDWRLDSNANNSVRFTVSDSVTSTSTISKAVTLSVDAWHFLIGRYNPSTKKSEVSFDGSVFSVSTTALANTTKNLYNTLAICKSGANYGKSNIDNVMWWTRYLEDNEATALYNGGAGTAYPF